MRQRPLVITCGIPAGETGHHVATYATIQRRMKGRGYAKINVAPPHSHPRTLTVEAVSAPRNVQRAAGEPHYTGTAYVNRGTGMRWLDPALVSDRTMAGGKEALTMVFAIHAMMAERVPATCLPDGNR